MVQENRVARVLNLYVPLLSDFLCWGFGSELFLFLMGFHRDILPILNDPKRRKWIYVFDSWEPEWENIERILLSSHGIEQVFFSSSQTVEHFRGRVPFPVEWLPQACDRSEIAADSADGATKARVVLNIGRTNSVLDHFFESFCERNNFAYFVPGRPGSPRCESRAEYLKLLHSSAIVVVHPRNMQYPEVTGCVSLLTARYFEAYSAGAVVCGYKPTSGEFEKVLGDMPFIEYGDSFEEQLLAALEQPDVWKYGKARCAANHTWDARLASLAGRLSQRQ